jgi:hypothetical protein
VDADTTAPLHYPPKGLGNLHREPLRSTALSPSTPTTAASIPTSTSTKQKLNEGKIIILHFRALFSLMCVPSITVTLLFIEVGGVGHFPLSP